VSGVCDKHSVRRCAQCEYDEMVARDFPAEIVDPWVRKVRRAGLSKRKGWDRVTIRPLLRGRHGTLPPQLPVVFVLEKQWTREDGGRCLVSYEGENGAELICRAVAFDAELVAS
jgi:hypothetical protein